MDKAWLISSDLIAAIQGWSELFGVQSGAPEAFEVVKGRQLEFKGNQRRA